MIIAITIILIVAMLCGTALIFGYWCMIHKEVNEYTLRDTKENTDEIKVEIEKLKKLHEQYIAEQLKEQK